MICQGCAGAADSSNDEFEVFHDCLDPIKCTCQHKPKGTGIKEPLNAQGEAEQRNQEGSTS
jgi:hypothetical protein